MTANLLESAAPPPEDWQELVPLDAPDAARRWNFEGRCVRIARPPRDMDFNDVLLGRLALEHGGTA